MVSSIFGSVVSALADAASSRLRYGHHPGTAVPGLGYTEHQGYRMRASAFTRNPSIAQTPRRRTNWNDTRIRAFLTVSNTDDARPLPRSSPSRNIRHRRLVGNEYGRACTDDQILR